MLIYIYIVLFIPFHIFNYYPSSYFIFHPSFSQLHHLPLFNLIFFQTHSPYLPLSFETSLLSRFTLISMIFFSNLFSSVSCPFVPVVLLPHDSLANLTTLFSLPGLFFHLFFSSTSSSPPSLQVSLQSFILSSMTYFFSLPICFP